MTCFWTVFFFPVLSKLLSVDVDVVWNRCQRCVPEIHSLCRSSSGRVPFTHWAVKREVNSEIREEAGGRKEAHPVLLLSWRPTKTSGLKRVSPKYFLVFSGGEIKTTKRVCSTWVMLSLPSGDSGPIATLHKVSLPLFMLADFSMSWNAMFLVLLTLYSGTTFYNKVLTEASRLCRHSGFCRLIRVCREKRNADELNVAELNQDSLVRAWPQVPFSHVVVVVNNWGLDKVISVFTKISSCLFKFAKLKFSF